MYKYLMILILAFCSNIYAQDVDTQLLDLKNEVAARKLLSQNMLIVSSGWRSTMHTLAELQGLRTQLVMADKWDLPTSITHGWITVSVANTTAAGMLEEWGIDPDSGMAQMMIMMYGDQVFAKESVIGRCNRLFNKANVLGGQTIALDESLEQVEAQRQSYKYGLAQLDPNDPNYYSYSQMYTCMISWCEDSLFDGYATSYANWEKIYYMHKSVQQDVLSIDKWYWNLVDLLDQ